MKGLPVPVSLAVMVVAILALGIFFGAWAVSADAEHLERSRSFSVAGNVVDRGAVPFDSSLAIAQRNDADGAWAGSKADTWWGKTLLKVCPVH